MEYEAKKFLCHLVCYFMYRCSRAEFDINGTKVDKEVQYVLFYIVNPEEGLAVHWMVPCAVHSGGTTPFHALTVKNPASDRQPPFPPQQYSKMTPRLAILLYLL